MTLTKDKVSIVIVTYNSLPPLTDSLKSLQSAMADSNHELIVVDNASTDESVATVRRLIPEATIIESKKNNGFARACNLGAARATGEFLLFHNPDLQIDPEAISSLVRVYRTHDDAGAVAGRMRFPDGSFQPTCRKFPTAVNMVFSRGSIISRMFKTATNYTLPDYETTTEVDAVAGTLLMIPTQLFRDIGGFDPRFFMYMEDTDLCLRLHQAGYHNYFEPSAGGVHLWGRGSTASSFRRNRYHHLSVWKYFLTHRPSFFAVFLLPLLLIANLLVKLFVKDNNEA